MNSSRAYPTQMENDQRILRYGYVLILLFLTLSGFGQMPIFKRYYVADIPGLGWLAKFLITHYIHYVGAILLIALFSYILVTHVMIDRSSKKITATGYIRGALLSGVLITGVFLVLRNLHDFWLPSGVIIFLDIAHLGMVVVFLLVALYCLVFKKPWTQVR